MLHRFKNATVKHINLFLIYIRNQNSEYSGWDISNSLTNLLFSNQLIVSTPTKWLGTSNFIVDAVSDVLNSDYKLTSEKISNYMLS